MIDLCRGVQGNVQGSVQVKTRLSIGLCKVCKALLTCVRVKFKTTSLTPYAHSRASCVRVPLHTLHRPRPACVLPLHRPLHITLHTLHIRKIKDD